MFSTLCFTLPPLRKHSVVRAQCSVVSVIHHFSVVGRSRSKDLLPRGQHLVFLFVLLILFKFSFELGSQGEYPGDIYSSAIHNVNNDVTFELTGRQSLIDAI